MRRNMLIGIMAAIFAAIFTYIPLLNTDLKGDTVMDAYPTMPPEVAMQYATSDPVMPEPSETEEMRAIWISFLEYHDARRMNDDKPNDIEIKYAPLIQGRTIDEAKNNIDDMFGRLLNSGFNTVILHARSHADAHYNSKLFPSSIYSSPNAGKLAKQGDRDMSSDWDPFGYMVNKANELGLSVHAWVNPYRIGVTAAELAPSHIALQWLNSPDAVVRDNIVEVQKDGKMVLSFNPAREQAMDYIVAGVAEIVELYGDKLSAIHFDDYFYPTTEEYFDQMAYNEYLASGGTLQRIQWRYENVNRLLKKVYNVVHSNTVNPNLEFGISPQGNYKNNYNEQMAEVGKWMSEDGYIDYIIPQIYWGFNHKTVPFERTTQEWLDRITAKNVKIYVGIGAYKLGSAEGGSPFEWQTDNNIIRRMIETSRKLKSKTTSNVKIEGFCIFDYRSLFRPTNTTKNLADEVVSAFKPLLQ